MSFDRKSDEFRAAYDAAADIEHPVARRNAERKLKATALAAYQALGLDPIKTVYFPTTSWLIEQVKLAEDTIGLEAALRLIMAAEYDAEADALEAKGGPRREQRAARLRETARVYRYLADQARIDRFPNTAVVIPVTETEAVHHHCLSVTPAAQAVIEQIAAELDPRSWDAVRQTPAFAVALDIARQERRSQIKLDQARAAVAAITSECEDGYEAADTFTAAHRSFRNDNNVLWGAARMLAAMVDNDDESGALSVLRDELDRQDAGKVEDPYDRWKRAQTR